VFTRGAGRAESRFTSKNCGTRLIVVSTRRPRQRKKKKNYDVKDPFERTLIPFCSIFYVIISIGLKDLEKALVIFSYFDVRRER